MRDPATLTHAVTLPQPLAWACCGPCPVTCSDTRPDMARIGELIGIHASRHWIGIDEAKTLEPMLGRKVTGDEVMAMQRRGALVGVARLRGVVREGRLPHTGRTGFVLQIGRGAVTGALATEVRQRIEPWWRPGTKWGLLLDEAVALSEPIPMRGAGGLWRITGRISKRMQYPGDVTAWALEQWRKGRAER